VWDYFGIGFGHKTIFRRKERFKFRVIINDSIMHDCDLFFVVAVGMGVIFCGAAMGGPANMPDAYLSW
jgi:hypothetical protein